MEYFLIVADVITGQPWFPDGTPQNCQPGTTPFRQRLPDKQAALALKDEYLTRFPRAQVEIESVDGTDKSIFQRPVEETLEMIASDADSISPRSGSEFRKLFKTDDRAAPISFRALKQSYPRVFAWFGVVFGSIALFTSLRLLQKTFALEVLWLLGAVILVSAILAWILWPRKRPRDEP